MHKIYRNRNKVQKQLSHQCIKCKQNAEVESIIGEAIEQKEKTVVDPTKYGTVPSKLYQHHSILVVDAKGEYHFKKFKETICAMWQEDIVITEIYQNFHKANHRRVFYMTHRKNYEEMRKVVENIDSSRKSLVLMKIKQQLSLTRQEFFEQACELLVDKFERYFQCKLRITYKTVPKGGK